MAFGLPHPTLGEDVAVAVIPARGLGHRARDPGVRRRAAGRLQGAQPGLPRLRGAQEPDRQGPAAEAGRVAGRARRPVHGGPRRAVERRIAAVWAEVLETGRVGTDDNFFDLGGNSLLLSASRRGWRRSSATRCPWWC
ncbi:phosphopantetheine-binding protein [Streptomyces sp. M19]